MEYNIYGIRYKETATKKRISVVCSAESGKEAISILEKTLQDKGHNSGYNNDEIKKIEPQVFETEFKTSKKGFIFGYDFILGNL